MKGLAAAGALLLAASAAGASGRSGPMRVVYVEASTGERWQLEDWPRRVGDGRFQVRLLREYAFDKSARVAEALGDPAGPPDAVVLQECSVYFPGPLPEYQQLFRRWVQDIRAAGAAPIVATVIPPGLERGWLRRLAEFVKVTLLRREKQFEQVLAFNDWLRQLAQEERLLLLDLEAAVRSQAAGGRLKPEFDAGDGIHVNAAAYAELDRLLLRTLVQLLPSP